MSDLSLSENRIWSGTVRRIEPAGGIVCQLLFGPGIYTQVQPVSGLSEGVKLHRIKVCGIQSRAFHEAERMAARRDHPLGHAGTTNAILRYLGIDGLYLGGNRLILLNRRVWSGLSGMSQLRRWS